MVDRIMFYLRHKFGDYNGRICDVGVKFLTMGEAPGIPFGRCKTTEQNIDSLIDVSSDLDQNMTPNINIRRNNTYFT